MNADTLAALQRAAATFEHGVLVADADSCVVWLSPPLLDATGHDLDALVGRPLTSLKRGHLGSGNSFSSGRAEYLDVFADPVPVWTTAIPVFEDGVVAGRLFIEREAPPISEGKDEALRASLLSTESLLKESQLLYRELFENSTDLIQSADTTGQLMFVNESWCRRLGYAQREATRLTVTDLLGDDTAEAVAGIFRCELPEPQQPLRFALRTRGGANVWVEGYVSYRRVEDRIVGTHSVLRDVTERERIERMKDEFVSMVNHELRTPLTSIAGALRLLQDSKGSTLDDQATKFLEIAVRNVDRLTNLVQEVLDYERLSAGKLQIRPESIDLRYFVRELIEDHIGFATARGVQIELESGPSSEVEADPKLLRHVVGNFLGNAIKYAPRDSTIRLGLTRSSGVARVWVHDVGPGVPLAFRPQAFEPFEQGEGSLQGTGLGLSIARTIANKLDIEIGFASVTDHGSCFFADVPVDDTTSGSAVLAVRANTAPEAIVEFLGKHPDATLELFEAPTGLDPARLLEEIAACPLSCSVTVHCIVQRLPPNSETQVFRRATTRQKDQK